MNIPEDIYNRVVSVIGKDGAELHAPRFDNDDLSNVKECITSGFVSSVGKFVDQLEETLRTYTKNESAVAVNSGTSGLHALLHSYGLNEDAEIIVPTISFIATANSIKYCNAVPHFVDVDPETLNICPIKLRAHLKKTCKIENGELRNKTTNRRIAAVLAVYVFGRPPNLIEISKICKEFGLYLFEDAAAALGSKYDGFHVGKYSEAAVVSFNGNKIITGGSGGVILTNNPEQAKHIRHITTTAKVPHPWEYKHDVIGFNYRMANLNAALLLSQFTKLEEIIRKKEILFYNYKKAFHDFSFGDIVCDNKNVKSNNWLINIKLEGVGEDVVEEVLNHLNSAKIKCRPVWHPLHLQTQFKEFPRGNLENAEKNWRKFISLPSSEY